MSISMRRAPASRAFSNSSLTTEAGRSMTSPAAIWSTRLGGRTRMGMPAPRLQRAAVYRGSGPVARERLGDRSALLVRTREQAPLRWKLMKIAADSAADGLREALLLRGSAQQAFLGGIGDVGGLDQHRRNIGRLEHHEARLLHFVFAHGTDPIERAEYAIGRFGALAHARVLRQIQQHRPQIRFLIGE